MELLDEIRLLFASLPGGAARLKSLPTEYPAFIIRNAGGFGIAVERGKEDAISEHFANAHFFSGRMYLAGEEKNVIMLQSYREDLRNEFACVCAQLADPGECGKERESLISTPLLWWKKWKSLLGNTIVDKAPYSVLCELYSLKRVYASDSSAIWTGSKAGTHDIETDTRSYEVKSTIRRYGASITISGQFQLLTPKPLELYFFRVEETPRGMSINEMVKDLVEEGYDKGLLEQQLSSQGYELGSSARERHFNILENRIYPIDDDFPKITEASFKNDKIPSGITQIVYTVDLEGLPYSAM